VALVDTLLRNPNTDHAVLFAWLNNLTDHWHSRDLDSVGQDVGPLLQTVH
jgi:hypothetical protein